MVTLSLNWFVFIYLIVFLGGVFTLWIGYEIVRNHSPNNFLFPLNQHQTQCRICGTIIRINQNTTSQDDLLLCPHCGSLVEVNYQGGL